MAAPAGIGAAPADIGQVLTSPVSSLVSALASAIDKAISDAATWAVGGMVHALSATTAVSLSGWFDAPWRAMLGVAAVVAVPILLVGVIQGALGGQPGELARRGLLSPLLVAVGTLGALGLVQGLLDLVSYLCQVVVQVGLGGPAGFGQAFARLPTDVGVPGLVTSTGPTPTIVSALLAAVCGVLAFAIWVELAVRAAAVYLLVAFVPLCLAGLFWSWAGPWLRRVVEVLVAVAASQLVITVLMVLAAADLGHGRLSGGAPGASIDTVVTAIGLLVLGSVGLPMALRLVPHTVEAVVSAGAGARVLRSSAAGGGSVAARSSVGRLAAAGAAGGGPGLLAAGAALAASGRPRRAAPPATDGHAPQNASTRGSSPTVPPPGQNRPAGPGPRRPDPAPRPKPPSAEGNEGGAGRGR